MPLPATAKKAFDGASLMSNAWARQGTTRARSPSAVLLPHHGMSHKRLCHAARASAHAPGQPAPLLSAALFA